MKAESHAVGIGDPQGAIVVHLIAIPNLICEKAAGEIFSEEQETKLRFIWGKSLDLILYIAVKCIILARLYVQEKKWTDVDDCWK